MEQDIKDALRVHGARYNRRECALQVFIAGKRVTFAYGGSESEALAVAVDRLSEVWAAGMTPEDEVDISMHVLRKGQSRTRNRGCCL